MLKIAGVSHSYGKKQALNDVGFEVPAGRFGVLLGPNGAGKTTLYGLLTQLLPVQKGSLSIAGHEVAGGSLEALEDLGIVFQSQTLDLDLTVIQNLRYFCRLRGIGASDATRRIDRQLERLDLAGRRSDKVRALNGGHRRRLEIARALLHEPKVLLLDEPTVGLDIPTRRQIVDDVHALAAEKGTTVLWATHLIDEIRAGDWVTVLNQGEVKAVGEALALLEEHDVDDISTLFDRLTGRKPQAPMKGVSRGAAA
ncbi:MAG: ATP-binding cassette domain-containing protein [Minwuia sp.]|uniref:ATP-binding cassette domain-containing protein n=1 Tax=Minwuia sp. TaxID=2493630 RepID=UPI003A8B5964